MISQADIIRTLVNQNCTDESIMSVALSPHCTPAKLLEKFTETERFDLALDVSMKLGLDTATLWRTWAMRCLRNRNFEAAREKFKICFKRQRPKSSRSSVKIVSSELLTEILAELSKMDEQRTSLIDEIKVIRQQDHSPPETVDQNICDKRTKPAILDKPTIYDECLHYLKEYGAIKDYIRFYVRQSLCETLVEVLIDKQAELRDENFFMIEVVMFMAATGNLDEFITKLLKCDPNIVKSKPYFHTIYKHCSSQRRYNLLTYIQTRIGDYVAAAEGQINYCFLKKPAKCYKELNKRVSSLNKAIDFYQEYLKKLNDKKHSISMKNDLKRRDVIKNDLFSEMNYFNVENRISNIRLQIEITRNFALNEVSGCISELGLNADCENKMMKANDDFPVTLLDHSESRHVYLVALVLIFYDPDCKSYFSRKGFELATRLAQKLQLRKLDVYKMAMRIILEDESCDVISRAGLLLDRLKQDYEREVKLIKRQPPSQLRRITLKPIARNGNKSKTVLVNRLVSTDRQLALGQRSEKASSLSSNLSSMNTDSSFSDTVSSLSPLVASATSVPSGRMRQQQQVRMETKYRGASLARVSPPNAHSTQHVVTEQRKICSPAFVQKSYQPRLESAQASPLVPLASADSESKSLGCQVTQRTPASLELSAYESAQVVCDEVLRDSIKCCREPDYKMELAKLLSPETKIELYIELGKLSNAQRLACSMNLVHQVERIIEEAERLNQNHIKTLCQHWLAKHKSQANGDQPS